MKYKKKIRKNKKKCEKFRFSKIKIVIVEYYIERKKENFQKQELKINVTKKTRKTK